MASISTSKSPSGRAEGTTTRQTSLPPSPGSIASLADPRPRNRSTPALREATCTAAALPSRGAGGLSILGLLESATRSGGAPLGSMTTTWPFRTLTPETRCWNR